MIRILTDEEADFLNKSVFHLKKGEEILNHHAKEFNQNFYFKQFENNLILSVKDTNDVTFAVLVFSPEFFSIFPANEHDIITNKEIRKNMRREDTFSILSLLICDEHERICNRLNEILEKRNSLIVDGVATEVIEPKLLG